ncbi:hypothetical protein NESM_000121000 [Novymonas esmeraldas]|uniref:Uncharacterized protein n=1 Tax=Novymonas esmeraldas TaxID=1808958 RepID=A0AAW0F4G0_9TRYP
MQRAGWGSSLFVRRLRRLPGGSALWATTIRTALTFETTSALAPGRHAAAACWRSPLVLAGRHVGHSGVAGLPPPPPLRTPGSRRAGAPPLPPPPPLTSARLSPAHGGGTTHNVSLLQLSPTEVISIFVLYVPSFFVSIQSVASLLPDETRVQLMGRGRFISFLKRYPFHFDLSAVDSGRCSVRLNADLIHPQRGEADHKYVMCDVGATTSYVARPEFVVCAENIESSASQRVLISPLTPPPSLRVRLEERVAVVTRLRTLVPSEFTAVETLEESIPEDVLFHPYFNCQGGLLSIAAKLPDEFQVVEGRIRRRPPHLAPLATDDLTLDNSPFPAIAALVRQHVCDSDIPHWVSITPLYELLTRTQKRELKQRFRSFAGFLRAHGQSLAVSTDMLQVSMWVSTSPPAPPPSTASAPAPVVYTREEVLTAWYDRFPLDETLTLRDAMQLLPVEMRTSALPTKIGPWLASHPHYFSVDFMEEEDPTKVLIRRASGRAPLDLALALYAALPSKDTVYSSTAVLPLLEPSVRQVVERIGLGQLAKMLPQWLDVVQSRDGHCGLQRLQSTEALELEMQRGRSRGGGGASVTAARRVTDVDAGLVDLEAELVRVAGD